ncbi:tRNA (adenosine(37)-N6)-threonylcarbamoyltransferase complex ATPase subunit type 1 TsaE [Patescibacteria group bacterium]|nr:tRNA (adenosine(37)-N6)-threonylcarbamoyltransferase complex ATPase subunit type 1 TsaE [Patescibacteria group bacterium]MBU3922897.1 tRNA (adenosine(37)-N6)-threonylcarbamoyltransferase complex ATPase subunit type 1 TsaE [Patescibacteria group bacterium]
MQEFLVKNVSQTKKLAKLLAREIKSPLVIAFQGELGAGKTTFIQAFAKELGIKSKITSPTFVLMKKYKNLYHIDCYRINSFKEILDLGFEEIIYNNIVVIEWAEKIKKILPKNTIWLKFKIVSEKQRKIQIL